MDQVQLVKDSLKKIEGVWTALDLQLFYRLSSANFTWFILEFFFTFDAFKKVDIISI